jgi:hypothetical protein
MIRLYGYILTGFDLVDALEYCQPVASCFSATNASPTISFSVMEVSLPGRFVPKDTSWLTYEGVAVLPQP